ncbi:peptidylprolyl isomerase [Flavihumibacter profundi]|uniref:peptidylprolyl isomerase n=1 Tax=Flavihumibacter profundi TaxID=2716883 RepID=UPI001CC5CFAB|nr:peptidylprolyl isomerase [Flavihumibacter profundi]MBZ5858799.1 peptidylprolyl isomerase [Flavihumibacter profundi]
MKKLFFVPALLLLLASTTINAQTLFTYGPYPVSKTEFLNAFRKNNNNTTPGQKAYADYLEMYIRYKLKVQAARAMRFDTIPTQKADLQDFRKQVINNYLADDSTVKFLVREAMEHCTKDLRISHIYFPFVGNDSAVAKEKAIQAMLELNKGAAFETVAQAYSADTSVKYNKGDIGWISAFVLPYPLEKLAYQTKVNTNSQPFKTSHAYHIFRITAERKSVGMLQIAQILISLPATANRQETEKAGKLADSIYKALQNGANFATLALTYSDDNASYKNQGVIQAFYPGTYDKDFEEQAVSLQKDNNISRPFRTAQGIHILKKIGSFHYSTDFNNETAFAAMKTRVLSDPRGKLAMDAVVVKAEKSIGFKKGTVPQSAIDAFTTAKLQGNATGNTLLKPQTVLATYKGKTIVVKDYESYLSTNASQLNNTQPGLSGQQVYQQFLQSKILEEYQQNLEKYNPDFARQLNEFKDGNMIFEAMQVNIWDKAVNDEAGLKQYFNQHKDKYTWKESVRAIIFNSLDSAAASGIYNSIRTNPSDWKQLADKSNGIVQADSGRYELDQLPKHTDTALKPGTITSPLFRAEDLLTTFIYIIESLPGNSPRSFEEAKGFVLNDYQLLLEEEWIKALKKKYPVKVNQQVLNSLNR